MNFNYYVMLNRNMAHRKQGYRFENDWTMEELEEFEKNWISAVTVPWMSRSRPSIECSASRK